MTTWGGDRKTMRVDFGGNGAAERDMAKAQRAMRPILRRRVLEVGGQRYVAYSAHELIELEGDVGRPGFLI